MGSSSSEINECACSTISSKAGSTVGEAIAKAGVDECSGA